MILSLLYEHRLQSLCYGWNPDRIRALEALKDKFWNNLLFGAFLVSDILNACDWVVTIKFGT